MRSIKNWVLATFILSFLVIIAGGVVRTTQSGMGCPDWPRCFGRWIPPTSVEDLPLDYETYLSKQDIDHSFNVFHTWTEYFNRLMGALLGVFAIIQSMLLYRQRKTLNRQYKLSLLFLAIVIITGLFGAIVVRLNLAHLSISVHLLLAVVLVQTQLALLVHVNSRSSVLPITDKLRKMLWFFLLVLLVQSVMGTMVRMHVDDVSKALKYGQRETWLSGAPAVFLLHRSFSWIVLLFALFMAWVGKNTAIKNKLFVLAGIVLLSMIAGIILYYADMPALAQPLHLLLATIAITQSFSILFQTRVQQAAGSRN